MKPTEQDRLLREILEDGEAANFRAASLAGGLDYLQRRRGRARVARLCFGFSAMVVLLFASAWLCLILRQPAALPPVRQAQAPKAAADKIKLISDEELFALFPGRAMALIGPRGHQELVFLDHGGTSVQQ